MKKILKKHPIMYSILLTIVVIVGILFVVIKLDEHKSNIEDKRIEVKEKAFIKKLDKSVYMAKGGKNQGILAFEKNKFILISEIGREGKQPVDEPDSIDLGSMLDVYDFKVYQGTFDVFSDDGKFSVRLNDNKSSAMYTVPLSFESNEYLYKADDTGSILSDEIKFNSELNQMNIEINGGYDNGEDNGNKKLKFKNQKNVLNTRGTNYKELVKEFNVKDLDSQMIENKNAASWEINDEDTFVNFLQDRLTDADDPEDTVEISNVRSDGTYYYEDSDSKPLKYKYAADVHFTEHSDRDMTYIMYPKSNGVVGVYEGNNITDDLATVINSDNSLNAEPDGYDYNDVIFEWLGE